MASSFSLPATTVIALAEEMAETSVDREELRLLYDSCAKAIGRFDDRFFASMSEDEHEVLGRLSALLRRIEERHFSLDVEAAGSARSDGEATDIPTDKEIA